MCGGRFDIAKPEAYLFGENSDLDLLGNRAVPVISLFLPKHYDSFPSVSLPSTSWQRRGSSVELDDQHSEGVGQIYEVCSLQL